MGDNIGGGALAIDDKDESNGAEGGFNIRAALLASEEYTRFVMSDRDDDCEIVCDKEINIEQLDRTIEVMAKRVMQKVVLGQAVQPLRLNVSGFASDESLGINSVDQKYRQATFAELEPFASLLFKKVDGIDVRKGVDERKLTIGGDNRGTEIRERFESDIIAIVHQLLRRKLGDDVQVSAVNAGGNPNDSFTDFHITYGEQTSSMVGKAGSVKVGGLLDL